MTTVQTKSLFYSAALFNWGAVAILILFAQALEIDQPLATMFGQIALVAIAIFGYGYWMVARDPDSHRGIVVLGALSKVAVVAVVWAGYIKGSVSLQMAALVGGDVIYAALFALFLARRPVPA